MGWQAPRPSFLAGGTVHGGWGHVGSGPDMGTMQCKIIIYQCQWLHMTIGVAEVPLREMRPQWWQRVAANAQMHTQFD